jgi:hypothetical protein
VAASGGRGRWGATQKGLLFFLSPYFVDIFHKSWLNIATSKSLYKIDNVSDAMASS